MAELNGFVGSYTEKHDDVLASLSFPYRIQSYAGPATTGTADAVIFEEGQLVCYDYTSGKLRKYVDGDSTHATLPAAIEGIVAERYDGQALNTAAADSGFVSVYIFGAFSKAQGGTALANQKVFSDTGASAVITNKEIISTDTISAARDRGLYID